MNHSSHSSAPSGFPAEPALSRQGSRSLGARLRSHGDLTAFLTELSIRVGADFYMLLAMPRGRAGEARILASNWVWDAVELVGTALIGRVAATVAAVAPGTPPQPVLVAGAPDLPGVLDGEEARLLHVLGHGEIWPLRVDAGRRRFFVLFSGAGPGGIDGERLVGAQMECGYALSEMPGLGGPSEDGLSRRERECLLWVAEGKTSEEVALILDVSAKTVNGYVAQAVGKLAAANRAMAIATAIRSGVI